MCGKRPRYLISSLLLLPTLVASGSFAAESRAKAPRTPDLVTLGVIDGESEGAMTTVTIRLDHKPNWQKLADLSDHGSFLQLTLPGTLVPEPGKFYDGGNALIPKVAVFQLTPSDAGIRFFVSKDAAKIKQATMAEILGNRIVLTIDGKLLSDLLAKKQEAAELVGPPAPPQVTADQVIARTEVSHDEPAPSDRLKADNFKAAKTQALATGGLDLRGKLFQATLFSAFMLVLLGLSWAVRPYLRKRAQAKTEWSVDEPLTIKTLASLNVASRQKVSLLQIGGERILIGVTPEHVSFLTTIGSGSNTPSAAARQGVQRLASDQAQLPRTSPSPRDFTQMLAEADAVAMHPTPALKPSARQAYTPQPASREAPPSEDRTRRKQDQATTNEDVPVRTPRTAARPSPNGAPPTKKPAPSRIQVSVGEDGIKNLAPPRPAPAKPASAEPSGQQAIDDVTRMIREKLKTLRSL